MIANRFSSEEWKLGILRGGQQVGFKPVDKTMWS
jgi:hypothetical protein